MEIFDILLNDYKSELSNVYSAMLRDMKELYYDQLSCCLNSEFPFYTYLTYLYNTYDTYYKICDLLDYTELIEQILDLYKEQVIKLLTTYNLIIQNGEYLNEICCY